jgi:hypothetical protein
VDWQTFVASLVRSLAWPLAVIAVAWLFREKLRALLENVQFLKGFGVEASFRDRLEKGRSLEAENIEGLPRPNKAETPPTERPDGANISARDVAATLANDPRAAVLASWRFLELALQRRLIQAGYFMPESTDVVAQAAFLAKRELLSANDLEVIRLYASLRNDAAHGSVFVDAASALLFAEVIDGLVERLDVRDS